MLLGFRNKHQIPSVKDSQLKRYINFMALEARVYLVSICCIFQNSFFNNGKTRLFFVSRAWLFHLPMSKAES